MNKKERAANGFERLAELADAPPDYKRKKSESRVSQKNNASEISDKYDTSEPVNSKPLGNEKSRKPEALENRKTRRSSKKEAAELKYDEFQEQRKVCKTPQVMKLVERTNDVNPVILAGKSRVPFQLRGKESLTRIMRRGLGEEFDDLENTVVVNITELAIEYEAPVILDRFNACSCDKCVEVFSKIIAERVPVRFARVNKNGRGIFNRELSERVEPMRKIVLTEMIKVLIGSKKRCFHDDL